MYTMYPLFSKGLLATSLLFLLAACKKTGPPEDDPTDPGTFSNYDLISRSTDGKSFGTYHGSVSPFITAVDATGVSEGQYVVYMTSWDVDPQHGGSKRQIMWFNRGNGKAAVVSRGMDGMGANQDSYNPVADSKGHLVAFESAATNLVAGDGNGSSDIFLWSLMSDEIECVTCSGNSGSKDAAISGDGRYIAFTSYADNLTSGVSGSSVANVYIKNMQTGAITLISKDPATGKGVGGNHASISDDGSRVAFYSFSNKLSPDDDNDLWDIFVWERTSSTIKRISLTAGGTERNQGSESASRIVQPTLSGNGKYVAFSTTATNMGGSPTTAQHVYVVNVDDGTMVRASESSLSGAGNGDSPIGQGERISLSYDGKWVAFNTNATNLGGRIIMKNIETGETFPFITNHATGVGTPTLSRNARCIAFSANEELDSRYQSTGIFATCR